jgi:chorismate mutase
MTSPPANSPPPSLDDVRRAIDGVDDAILALLQQRIALVDGVIAAKAG